MSEKHVHRRDDEDNSFVHMREDDPWARRSRIFSELVKTLGFPVIVCMYFAFQQYTQGRETIQAINSFKEVVSSLKVSIDQQTKIMEQQNRLMRHRPRED